MHNIRHNRHLGGPSVLVNCGCDGASGDPADCGGVTCSSINVNGQVGFGGGDSRVETERSLHFNCVRSHVGVQSGCSRYCVDSVCVGTRKRNPGGRRGVLGSEDSHHARATERVDVLTHFDCVGSVRKCD